MHRDHKLALSLGLLLIGVAAALCFPRQQPSDLAGLELEDAAQLDAAIDLLPVRVYTESHAESTDNSEELATSNPQLADPFSELALLPGAPDPIPTVEIRPTPENRANTIAQPPPSESPGGSPRPTSDAPRVEPPEVAGSPGPSDVQSESLVYEVQPGDTLSELAGRFLGSTRRFLELYEANRDILASPDDLQVGMLLKIPGLNTGDSNGGVRVARTPPETEGGSAEPAVESSNQQGNSSPPTFRPAARSPFAPGTDGTGLPN